MKFGFDAPIGGPDATPERLARLVRHGEEMGFDIIGAGDHIVIPRTVDSRYPYTQGRCVLNGWGGRLPRAAYDPCLHRRPDSHGEAAYLGYGAAIS